MVSFNQIAKEIAEKEGINESITIPQIKTVLKATIKYLNQCTVEELSMILQRQQ